jgi:hypothetical protein
MADHTRNTLAAATSSSDAVWWKLERQANGSYIIGNKANANMVLAINLDLNTNHSSSTGTNTTDGYTVIATRDTMQSQYWNFYLSTSGAIGAQVYPAP